MQNLAKGRNTEALTPNVCQCQSAQTTFILHCNKYLDTEFNLQSRLAIKRCVKKMIILFQRRLRIHSTPIVDLLYLLYF